MSKTLADKKVNHEIKRLNRSLEQDVFKRRFWARQCKKTQVNGTGYYLYELCDREEPERNQIISHWYNEFEILLSHKIWIEMNDFIITSDFWEKYRKEKN